MASFAAAYAFTQPNEGGFRNRASDPGNWYQGELLGTNHGISAPVAREHGYRGRMQDLPLALAIQWLQEDYWRGLDDVQNQAVATKIFDMRVQWGRSGGSSMVQQALVGLGWSLAVDGVIGPLTLAAINQEDPETLVEALCVVSESAYRADVAAHPSKLEWLSGWIARARKIPPGLAAVGALGIVGLLGAFLLARYVVRG